MDETITLSTALKVWVLFLSKLCIETVNKQDKGTDINIDVPIL